MRAATIGELVLHDAAPLLAQQALLLHAGLATLEGVDTGRLATAPGRSMYARASMAMGCDFTCIAPLHVHHHPAHTWTFIHCMIFVDKLLALDTAKR